MGYVMLKFKKPKMSFDDCLVDDRNYYRIRFDLHEVDRSWRKCMEVVNRRRNSVLH